MSWDRLAQDRINAPLTLTVNNPSLPLLIPLLNNDIVTRITFFCKYTKEVFHEYNFTGYERIKIQIKNDVDGRQTLV